MTEVYLFDWFNIQASLSAVCILKGKFGKITAKNCALQCSATGKMCVFDFKEILCIRSLLNVCHKSQGLKILLAVWQVK